MVVNSVLHSFLCNNMHQTIITDFLSCIPLPRKWQKNSNHSLFYPFYTKIPKVADKKSSVRVWWKTDVNVNKMTSFWWSLSENDVIVRLFLFIFYLSHRSGRHRRLVLPAVLKIGENSVRYERTVSCIMTLNLCRPTYQSIVNSVRKLLCNSSKYAWLKIENTKSIKWSL